MLEKLQKGIVIDDMQLVEKIGEGGFGHVWKVNYLGAQAVAKFLKDPKTFKQIQIEAIGQYKISRMQDEIARCFVRIEHFSAHSQPPYMRMEFVEGKSLDKLIANRTLNIIQSLEIFERLLKAIEFAHKNGFVHGDLKPSNIIITNTDPYLKIIDLGFGMEIDRANPAMDIETSYKPISLTVSTQMGVATIVYSAPERFQRDFLENPKVAVSCDIFSMGRILYEMLTFETPNNVLPVEHRIKELPEGFDKFLLRFVENDWQKRWLSAKDALAKWQELKIAGVPKKKVEFEPPDISTPAKVCLKCLFEDIDPPEGVPGLFGLVLYAGKGKLISKIDLRPRPVHEEFCKTCGEKLSKPFASEELFKYKCEKCLKIESFYLLSAGIGGFCAGCGRKWDYGKWRKQIISLFAYD
jgi:serine/threonine protein kinase